jgi:hypothetical protein
MTVTTWSPVPPADARAADALCAGGTAAGPHAASVAVRAERRRDEGVRTRMAYLA